MPRPQHPIIDTDLHHHFPSTAALEPYLPEGTRYPYFGGEAKPHPQGYFREDTVSPRGGLPASDPEFVVEHLLDRYGIEHAILSCGSTLGIGNLPDVDVAADVARATNDWTINEWFPADERFLGAIVVAMTDPEQAAAEIRRVGSHPRMVVATITNAPCWLGNPFLHPVYEACEEMGIPLNLHPGGTSIAAGVGLGPSATFCQFRTAMCFTGVEHMMSLIFDGVFVKYPNFKFVLNEYGTSWLPFVLWRMDMEYREAREEVPWLTKLPSQYVRDSVRLTTQPVDEADDRKQLIQVLSAVDAQDLLMFSTDYPHHDFDNPEVVLRSFPDEWQQKICWDNAWEWYDLEHRLAADTQLAAAAR